MTNDKEDKLAILTEAFRSLALGVDEDLSHAFVTLYNNMIRKNEHLNLTAIVSFEEVCYKHFWDSLSLLLLKEDVGTKELRSLLETDIRVIDIGSGAGFPGLPLKMYCPNMQMTLMDSLGKRVDYLNEVIGTLQLKDTRAVHARAEELGQMSSHRGQYDLAVSRAVAKLAVLCEYALPFIKAGGFFVAYKGSDCKDEVDEAVYAINQLGGKLFHVKQFVLPFDESRRSLVVIYKETETNKKYPRRPGIPAKRPLVEKGLS